MKTDPETLRELKEFRTALTEININSGNFSGPNGFEKDGKLYQDLTDDFIGSLEKNKELIHEDDYKENIDFIKVLLSSFSFEIYFL